LVVIAMAVKNREMIDLLANTPVPPMPAHLVARVHAAISAESAKRSAERAAWMRALGEKVAEVLQRGGLDEADRRADDGLVLAGIATRRIKP
jgi:hypothetical protein